MSSDVALRTAAFKLEDQWLFWPRVRLYPDRLELSGWSLSGRYRRSVPLPHLEEAEAAGRHLVLRLANGSSLRIEVEAPEEWAAALRTHRDVRERSGRTGEDTAS